MQLPTVTGGGSGDILVDRLKANQLILYEAILRLSSVRAATEEQRSRGEHLRAEVQQSLAALRKTVAAARQRTSVATPAKPALPRHRPAAPNPRDVVRHQLHTRYAATRDPALRADLMASYDGFARSLAIRLRGRESLDDLIQVARIGLLHAIDRFDPTLGRPFPVFARITITGELKRHIRDRTWGMRIPRSLQEDYLNVMRAVEELTAEHSASPSMDALADYCGMTVERVMEAMELRVTQRALSIDSPVRPGSDDPLIELGQEEIGFRQLENRQLLAGLIARLPERDRHILELRFIDELTQSEIADRVGVSQMCVSRVLARTLGRLRVWARNSVN
ncbi:MAG TPA: sigma-70 family RNA polymerase sigma factor [Acidimicrobiia bacterium]|nr:sigma-70 family RNA polymerase sigma factor [Acidimicrobiia bacterium]